MNANFNKVHLSEEYFILTVTFNQHPYCYTMACKYTVVYVNVYVNYSIRELCVFRQRFVLEKKDGLVITDGYPGHWRMTIDEPEMFKCPTLKCSFPFGKLLVLIINSTENPRFVLRANHIHVLVWQTCAATNRIASYCLKMGGTENIPCHQQPLLLFHQDTQRWWGNFKSF